MKTKRFKPPTLEVFIAYIRDNKLAISNPEGLYQGYSDGGWIDTRGNIIRNWKLKLHTLHNFRKVEKPVFAKPKCWCGLEAILVVGNIGYCSKAHRQEKEGW